MKMLHRDLAINTTRSSIYKWSPLSKYLARVQFSACVPGDDKSPCETGGVTENEIRYKEEKLFHNALDELNDYWDGHSSGRGRPTKL